MKIWLIDKSFPFVLGVLVLCGTQLFPPLFNPSTRWLFVLFAFILAWISPYARLASKTSVFVLLVFYLGWCFLTAMWSEMWELSIYKAFAAFFVMIGMFTLGFTWMMRRDRIVEASKSGSWLVLVSLLVAVSGKAGTGLLEQGQNYYSGLAGNSNYLGWMMAVSLPFLVWKAFDHSISARLRWLVWALTGICAYYLLLSQSRAAMILTFCSLFGLFISSGRSKRTRMVGISLFLFMAAFLVIPNLFDFVYSKFILKGTGSNLANAYEISRGTPFEESLDFAIEGGIFGGGYGISIGANPLGYHGGLSAVGYGREKGSSPLAIVEETGLIGLTLVVLLLWRLFAAALKAYRRAKSPEVRSIVGMLTGLLLGMILHAHIEAWWVAPGSAESMFFWGFSGMAYALFLRLRKEYPERRTKK